MKPSKRSGRPRPIDPRHATRTAVPTPAQRLRTLDRVLSKAGLGSRTQASAWIREGRVKVDGRVVTDPERWLDPDRQRVTLDDRSLGTKTRICLLLYKPKGVLTALADEGERRKTVFDLLPETSSFVFPVGRLDLDSSGLLLMTNDSQLGEQLTNPAFKIPKTYVVKASTRLSVEQLEQLRRGVLLDDGPTRPAVVTPLREPGGRTVFEMTITEGRNRQVRRMVEAVGSKVIELVRVAIGPLRLGDLRPGECRELSVAELRSLSRSGSTPARPRPRRR